MSDKAYHTAANVKVRTAHAGAGMSRPGKRCVRFVEARQSRESRHVTIVVGDQRATVRAVDLAAAARAFT